MGPISLTRTVAIRLWDAAITFFAVLFGRLERRSIKPTLQVRRNAELQNALLEVNSVLERLHAWTTRQGARESRAAKRALDLEPGEPGTHSPMVGKSRKSQLRAYFHGRGGPPPPVAPVPKSNGDEQVDFTETGEEEEENP